MGRFINADAYTSTGQGVLGNNMFAYCNSNPVTGYDPSGHFNKNTQQIQLEGSVGAAGLDIVTGFLFSLVLVATKELADELAQALTKIEVAVSPPAGDYTVYFLCKENDISKSIIYVGRVKTSNFDSRMDYHRTKGREYVTSISNLSYEACRAIEQGGMMYYHTINRDSAINNQIRGISPTNPKRQLYLEVIHEMISRNLYLDNSVLPISYWENLTENEFLNIVP